MQELGVLRLAAKTAVRAAEANKVTQIQFFTLEIGDESGYVPLFFEKYFPIIREEFPALRHAQLRMETVKGGRRLLVKEIGF